MNAVSPVEGEVIRQNAGPKLLSVPVAGLTRGRVQVKESSGRSFPAGEREPGKSPTLKLRGTHKPRDGSTRRAALKTDSGNLESKNGRGGSVSRQS